MKELKISQDNLEKALNYFGIDKSFAKPNPFLSKEKETILVKSQENELGKAPISKIDKAEAKSILLSVLELESPDKLEKAFNDKFESFSKNLTTKTDDLVKSFQETEISLKKQITDLEKSVTERDDLIKSIASNLVELNESIKVIGAQPLPRKSFLKENDLLKKSFNSNPLDSQKEEGGDNNGLIPLSLSAEKKKIRDIVENKLDAELSKGIKGPFVLGAEKFDADGILSPAMITELKALGILITK